MAETKVKKNKKTEKTEEKVVSKYAALLKSPRVTEKSNILMQQNVYVFDVALDAGKREIIKAVKDMYKVTPVKVNTIVREAKGLFFKGKKGRASVTKKAYVYLKEGDKIEN